MYPASIFRRNNIKLAEAMTSQSQSQQHSDSPPPPPPSYHEAIYSGPRRHAMPDLDDAFCYDSDTDDEDESEDEELAPIVIRLDSSITIDGSHNTVMLPLAMNPGSADQKTHEKTATESQDGPSSSSSSSSEKLIQQYRHSRSAHFAQSIILALKQAGVLGNTKDGDARRRPIEINLNAGLRIRGERNVVCTGVPLKRSSSSSKEEEEEGTKQCASGKRSAPVEESSAPPSKRRNLSKE